MLPDGVAPMPDAVHAKVHTFAVGAGQFVVHHCGDVTFRLDASGASADNIKAINLFKKVELRSDRQWCNVSARGGSGQSAISGFN
jgi:hypothetical protein